MAKISLQSKTLLSTKSSILIIGPQVFFDKISSPLKTKAEALFKLSTDICSAELIKDVTERTNYSFFDSIIMVVDTTREHFSLEVIEALKGIPSQHLSTRLLLVNGCSGSCSFISNVEFKRIADRFNVNYLSAEIKDPDSCDYLIDRLVELIDLTTGITSGKPMTAPTAKVLSNISQYYAQEFIPTHGNVNLAPSTENYCFNNQLS